MPGFVEDSFTDTSGTVLSSHTPNIGGTWTKHGSYTGDMNISDANRLRMGSGTASRCFYNSTDPAGAEYDLECIDRVITAANNAFGMAGRIATGANTMYMMRYQQSTGNWQLYKIVTGTATLLGEFTQARTSSTESTVKLEIRDATKKVYIDGVERISSTDNAITAAGKAGFRDGSGVAGSNTTGIHLDSFVATDVGGAAGQPAIRRFGGFAGIRTFGGSLRVWRMLRAMMTRRWRPCYG